MTALLRFPELLRALCSRSIMVNLAGPERPPLSKVAFLQLAATGTVFLLLLVIGISTNVAVSALLGGLLATIINGYFGWRAFRQIDADDPHRILGEVIRAEVGKVLLISVSLALLFKYADVLDKLVLLLSFMLMMIMAAVVSAWMLLSQSIQQPASERDNRQSASSANNPIATNKKNCN